MTKLTNRVSIGNTARKTTGDFQMLISAKSLHSRITNGEMRVIDTRSEEDFNDRHIEGAVNLPSIFTYLFDDAHQDFTGLCNYFSESLGGLGISESSSVVICEDTLANGYGQSCRGYFILKCLGHKSVQVLHGGLAAWTKHDFPMVSGRTTPYQECEYRYRIRTDLLADKSDVLAALNGGETILLDCRDKEEWTGVSSSPYGRDFCPRKGRIPGAVWIEWYSFLETIEGVPFFRDPNETKSLLASAGIFESSDVIIYCFKGSRAATVQLAMSQAGFHRSKNYLGSWNEWSRDMNCPCDQEVLDSAADHLQ